MGIECCSIVVLCFGAVATMSAIALVAIGSTTDHWTVASVNRTSVYEHNAQDMNSYMYFPRHRGLFRTCFPETDRPPESELYLSVLEDWCMSRDYYLSDLMRGRFRPENISDPGHVQLQLLRTTPILLVVYLFSMCIVGIVGLCGCWQQSANKLITTAAFQLLSALVGACAMATWHAALFYEMEKVHDEGFPLDWPIWLQESSTVETGWSYILCWAGICLTLVASLLTSSSAICLRSHKRKWVDNSLRMKLQMSRMFAQHAYFPDQGTPTPRDYPTMQANYPTKQMMSRDAYELRRESPQNNSRQPFLSGSSDRLAGSGPTYMATKPPQSAKNRIIHSREASDLSDSYKADDYRKVMSELHDSRF